MKTIHYKQIDSTNDEAKRLIQKGEAEGTVVVADEQTKGRGKPGSSWYSPPGVAVYLSAIFKPDKDPLDLSLITIAAAQAVVATINNVAKVKASIKKPNDVLVNGKKICGILTERLASGYLIIGIGINVNNEAGAFPKEINATSLKIESSQNYDVSNFIDELLLNLDKEYLAYLSRI